MRAISLRRVLLWDGIKDHIKADKHVKGLDRLKLEAQKNLRTAKMIDNFAKGDLKGSDVVAMSIYIPMNKAYALDEQIYRDSV